MKNHEPNPAVGKIVLDRRGLALIEFALSFPLVMVIGGFGIELSNVALTNMKISQYALNLADAASRVGVDVGGGVTQLREADINDVLQGARIQGLPIALGTNGRVVLSSLENTKQSYDTVYKQRIHWQRCFGMQSGSDYNSHYGTTPVTAGSTASASNAGSDASTGMGEASNKVNAPKDSGVMFVEINYLYSPIFGNLFISPRIIRYSASMLVRDNRDYTQIQNPSPAATAALCNTYTI